MKTTRFTIDLDPEFDAKLAKLAADKGTTKATIIRNALATYSFISGSASANSGLKVSITTEDDRVVKDIVIP